MTTSAHAGLDHLAAEWERAARLNPQRAISPAVEYDESGRLYAARLFELIPPDPAIRLLELGCGDGRVTQWLEGRYAEIVAVDIAPTMLDLLAARGLTGVTCWHSNGADLPHVPVDAVYSDSVLMHNRHDDVVAIFARMRELVPDGAPFALQLPVYAAGGSEPGDWIGVGTWTPEQLTAAADETGWALTLMAVSPGRYEYQPGPAHADLHLMRAV